MDRVGLVLAAEKVDFYFIEFLTVINTIISVALNFFQSMTVELRSQDSARRLEDVDLVDWLLLEKRILGRGDKLLLDLLKGILNDHSL